MLWIFDSLLVIVALETVSVLFTTFDDDLGVLLLLYPFPNFQNITTSSHPHIKNITTSSHPHIKNITTSSHPHIKNITTSSDPHIKNINFVMQKSHTQNNTVVQSMLFVNWIQYKFTCLLLCLLNFCHIKTYVRKRI